MSKKIATKTKKWEQVGKINTVKADKKAVILTKEECLQEFEKTKTLELEGSRFFGSHEMHDVSYERLMKNQDEVLNETSEFFGIR